MNALPKLPVRQDPASRIQHRFADPETFLNPPKYHFLPPLKKQIMQVTVCKSVTFAAKAPKMPVASPLASLSPQRGLNGERD